MVSCKFCFLISVLAIALLLPVIYRYKAGCIYDQPLPGTLKNKIALVTGANTGIGYETVQELVRLDCQVIMACRSTSRCTEARQLIIDAAKLLDREKITESLLTTLNLDLGSLKSVQSAAMQLIKEQSSLHYLILNAGVIGSTEVQYTKDGFELHFGVNHLGHFLLTELLLPFMKANRKPNELLRVISVSSMAHYMYADKFNFDDLGLVKNYSVFYSYGQSKLANVLHMRHLVAREKLTGQPDSLVAVSVHPGAVFTELARNLPFADTFNPLFRLASYLIFKTPWEGAQTTLHCALVNNKEILPHNGKYFHDCAPRVTSETAQSSEVAQKLWDLSENLVKPFMMKLEIEKNKEPAKVKQPEPAQVKQPEPAQIKQPEPIKVKQPEPAKVKQPELNKVKQPEPAKVKQPELIKVKQPELAQGKKPEPAKVKQPEPAKVKQPEPIKVKQPEPAQVKQPEPAKVKQPEPAQVKQPEPAKIKQPEPIKVKQPEPTQVKQPKPVKVKQAGTP